MNGRGGGKETAAPCGNPKLLLSPKPFTLLITPCWLIEPFNVNYKKTHCFVSYSVSAALNSGTSFQPVTFEVKIVLRG
jgi:hypothetical protein